MLSGFQPTLKSLESNTMTWVISQLNPCRWILEGLWISEVREWPSIYEDSIESVGKGVGWDMSNYYYNVYALLCLGFVVRFATWASLYLANRNKQL